MVDSPRSAAPAAAFQSKCRSYPNSAELREVCPAGATGWSPVCEDRRRTAVQKSRNHPTQTVGVGQRAAKSATLRLRQVRPSMKEASNASARPEAQHSTRAIERRE